MNILKLTQQDTTPRNYRKLIQAEYDLFDPRLPPTILRCLPMRYVIRGMVLAEFFYLPQLDSADDSD